MSDMRWALSALGAISLLVCWAGRATADDLLDVRRAQVASLPVAEQQELLRRQERFAALPAEEQERLRALQAAMDADQHADRLRQVLARYHEWLKTLTPSQRAKLADLPPHERVAEIKRLQQQQQASRDRMQRANLLTWGDMREVVRWTEDYVWSRSKDLLAEMPKDYRQRFEKWDRQKQRRALLFWALGRARREGGGGALAALEPSDIDRLSANLSEPAQRELAGATSLDARRKLVGSWIGASMHRLEPWGPARKQNSLVVEELLQYLQNEVPPADRERLLKLPREKMLEELRGMYFERGRGEMGPGGPPWFDGRSPDRAKGGFRGKGNRPGGAFRPPGEDRPGEDPPAEKKTDVAPPGNAPVSPP